MLVREETRVAKENTYVERGMIQGVYLSKGDLGSMPRRRVVRMEQRRPHDFLTGTQRVAGLMLAREKSSWEGI
jgi:hypothetical protein